MLKSIDFVQLFYDFQKSFPQANHNKKDNKKGCDFAPFIKFGGAAGYCLRVRKIAMIPFYMLSRLFHWQSPEAANDKTSGAPI